MEIRIDDKARIFLSEIPEVVLFQLREVCTFQNPDFKKRERLGFSTWNLDPEFKLFQITDSEFIFSRGLVKKIIKVLNKNKIQTSINEILQIKNPTKFNFTATLSDDQIEFFNSIKDNGGGLYVAPCGLGKTVIGLSLVDYFGGRTLIIVHTKKLLDQWVKSIVDFLGVPKNEIGIYGASKHTIGKQITVGLMQSLVRNMSVLTDEFDVVFSDECLSGDSLIMLPDGSNKTIKKVVKDKDPYVMSLDGDRLVSKKVLRWFKNPIKNRKILKFIIKTKHGIRTVLKCTENHKIYTNRGLVRADNIVVGDIIKYIYRFEKQPFIIRGDHIDRIPGKSNLGPSNSKWKGGRTVCGPIGRQYYYLTKSGLQYNIKILSKLSNVSELKVNEFLSLWDNELPERIRESFLVASLNRGGLVKRPENVHHIDGNRLNDNYSNLEIMACGKHSSENGNQYCRRPADTELELAEVICIKEKIFKGSDRRCNSVYNLEVEDTHNYVSNGVVVSNCHHCPCETLFGVMNNLRAKIKIGCTATPKRKDKKEFLLFASLGDILYASRGDPNRRMEADLYIVPTNFDFPYYRQNSPPIVFHCDKVKQDISRKIPVCGYRACEDCIFRWEKDGVEFGRKCDHKVIYNRNHTILLTRMGQDHDRNMLIFQYVVYLYQKGVKILVLFNRIDIILLFRDTLARVGIDAGLVIGGNRPGVDVETACRMFQEGSLSVLIGSSVADEGLDLPHLECVVFGSPCASHLSLMEQRLGRAERKYPGKIRSLGVYFLDWRLFPGHQRLILGKYPKAKKINSYSDISLSTIPIFSGETGR